MARLNSMIQSALEDRVYSLKKMITVLEWDMKQIKDDDVLRRKNAHLTLLRSELKDLQVRSEDS